MLRHALYTLLTITIVLAFAGCASTAPRSSSVNYGEGVKVSGVVTYRERIAMPKGAVVIARLVDITKSDAPIVLCEQKITAPGQVPVPFVLTADGEDLSEYHNYAIEATINVGGKPRWRNTQQYGVITRGNPTTGLMVWVQQIDY